MKNVLILCPQGASPVQIYRGIGVLEQLRKIDPQISVFHPIHNDPWESLIHADVVYAMRTSNARDLAFLHTAQAMGIPVWYDADDDYFGVTPDSPVFAAYQNPTIQKAISQFLSLSDYVTVSTQDLKNKFEKYRDGKPIEVVNNALDDYIFRDGDIFPAGQARQIIAWRGGATHQADLACFADQFWEFFDSPTAHEWKAQFIGFYPLIIEEGLDWCPKNYTARMLINEYDPRYYQYVRSLRDGVKPFAMAVPLRDNPFNRAKSNIAALEAVYAGAVPVVPNWEEWQFPGAIRYDKREDFGKCLLKISRMKESTRKEIWQENIKFIEEKYLLSKVNAQRVEIVNRLVK